MKNMAKYFLSAVTLGLLFINLPALSHANQTPESVESKAIYAPEENGTSVGLNEISPVYGADNQLQLAQAYIWTCRADNPTGAFGIGYHVNRNIACNIAMNYCLTNSRQGLCVITNWW
jgi:hypothetical protein